MKKFTIAERNRLANQYGRELGDKVGSPFRRKLYVDARIAGKTHDEALAIAQTKPETR